MVTERSHTNNGPVRGVHHIPGVIRYEDNTPAANATLTFTMVSSGEQVAVVVADRDGKFYAPIVPAEYAIAATAERGTTWIERQMISDSEVTIQLSNEYKHVTGHITTPDSEGSEVSFSRNSRFTGDTFITYSRHDGGFSLCLAPGRSLDEPSAEHPRQRR